VTVVEKRIMNGWIMEGSWMDGLESLDNLIYISMYRGGWYLLKRMQVVGAPRVINTQYIQPAASNTNKS
jgi:hypothetical protein